jgi:hypothetical protein
MLVSVQLSVLGLYLTPSFVMHRTDGHENPPQTIISLPVQTAVSLSRLNGAAVMAVHVSVLGSYFPPVFKPPSGVGVLYPPKTIISKPVQTAV